MKKWMLLALTLILAIGLSACGGSSSGKSANNGKTVLTLALWDTNQKKSDARNGRCLYQRKS
ncbi:hypothetical protein [Listeria grayi]|uniref:hypothetical protein n=1 Tax=Listeria grayi TaxID=1641 RepID=UPI0019D6B5FF|nr:hypothetical protein [Listeria grayi]